MGGLIRLLLFLQLVLEVDHIFTTTTVCVRTVGLAICPKLKKKEEKIHVYPFRDTTFSTFDNFPFENHLEIEIQIGAKCC